jgi:hypothetical protein
MIAFFLTMPSSRMMPIRRDHTEVLTAHHQRQHRAHARRRERGEDRDRVNVALVQHAEHDVHGHHRGEDQVPLVLSEA